MQHRFAASSIPRSYLNETLLDPKKTYIFVEFPHGVYPMSEVRARRVTQSLHSFEQL